MNKETKLRVYRFAHPYRSELKDLLVVVGAYRNKPLFISEVKKKFDLDDPLIDKEDRQEINESLKEIMDVNSDNELYLVAIENPEQLVILPYRIFNRDYWKPIIEAVDMGKFVYEDVLERFEKMGETIEKAEKYDKLKERLIQLGENLKTDEEYMV